MYWLEMVIFSDTVLVVASLLLRETHAVVHGAILWLLGWTAGVNTYMILSVFIVNYEQSKLWRQGSCKEKWIFQMPHNSNSVLFMKKYTIQIYFVTKKMQKSKGQCAYFNILWTMDWMMHLLWINFTPN